MLICCIIQASIGNCNTKKPGMMDFLGRTKWDAWNNLRDMAQVSKTFSYRTQKG